MALATQCPHCQTIFRVAADQLKLRSGLVRCGACRQIFNGIENLVRPEQLPQLTSAKTEVPDLAPQLPQAQLEPAPPASEHVESTPAPVSAPQSSPESTLDFVSLDNDDAAANPAFLSQEEPTSTPLSSPGTEVPDALARMTTIDMMAGHVADEADKGADDLPPEHAGSQQESVAEYEADELPIMAAPPVAESAQAIEPTTGAEQEFPAPVEAHAVASLASVPSSGSPNEFQADMDGDRHELAAPLESGIQSTTEAIAANREPAPDAESDVDADADAAYEPSFVTSSRRRQRIHRIARIFMSIASVFMLLGATAQAAYTFRNQLAAWFPQYKPQLVQFCELAGCKVQLPAQIDMVSIEASELQAATLNKNVFTLTVLLRNRSSVAQAWPEIELTLNDANEKPVLRRILTSRDYLASNQELAKGLAATSELPVKVTFELDQVKASGYRVYLFYS